MTSGRKNAQGFDQDWSPVGRQVEEPRNHHRIERPVSEWQRSGRRHHGVNAHGRRCAAQDVEHFLRPVCGHDTIAGAGERNRNAAGAGREVEDAPMYGRRAAWTIASRAASESRDGRLRSY
jgi:hypothetical protein